MDHRNVSDETIARYLLGELPAGEQEELERGYFADPELLERMDAIEDELIDDYVRDALTPEQRKQFERHFLNARRLERVRMAQALRTVAPRRVAGARWMVPLAAALFGAALLAIVWLALENRTLRESGRRAEVRPASPAPVVRPVPVEQAPEPAPPAPQLPTQIATIVLSPGLTRGDDTPNAVIPRGAESLRIVALLEVEAPRYDATLQRSDGTEVWKGNALSAREGKLVLMIPRASIGDGEHLLTVTAPDFIADYAFTVTLEH